MKVRIPTPLRSYTGNATTVDVDGNTLAEVIESLDAHYPGLRFRIVDEQGRLRQHVNIFIHGERCRDLTTTLDDVPEVVIMQALSGG